jgi:hypothetical protein
MQDKFVDGKYTLEHGSTVSLFSNIEKIYLDVSKI